jgi:hypothetical protein
METFVVPAYLFMKSFGLLGGRTVGICMSLQHRMYYFSKLFDEHTFGNSSVHRRLITLDNLGEDQRTRRCRITGWTCEAIPAKILSLPRLVAIDVIRDTFEAYPLYAETIKGVHFFTQGHEAGVFSSMH